MEKSFTEEAVWLRKTSSIKLIIAEKVNILAKKQSFVFARKSTVTKVI